MANSDWNTVEISDLTEQNARLYAEAKAAYRVYKVAKEAFEQAMQAGFAQHLGEGQELKFGYNFGKLSIAVGEKRERKVAKAKASLTDWLAAQGQGGHRS